MPSGAGTAGAFRLFQAYMSSDIGFKEKMRENEAQHQALQGFRILRLQISSAACHLRLYWSTIFVLQHMQQANKHITQCNGNIDAHLTHHAVTSLHNIVVPNRVFKRFF